MKILLIDRDAELAASIAFTLRQIGCESCLADDSASAVRLLELESPDLVLLEHHAPAIQGIEICRALRQRSNVPIMMLSAHDREEELIAAVEAGADDYLRKPFSPRVLLARVKSLLRRVDGAAPTALTVANVVLDLHERMLRIGTSAEIHLTPHELTVVRLLMTTPARTVTGERLISQLWGSNSGEKQRMLKQLIYRLRQKVEIDPSRPRLILTTPQAGYRIMAGCDEPLPAATGLPGPPDVH
jgi:DNA-binding response OmpR family regulator